MNKKISRWFVYSIFSISILLAGCGGGGDGNNGPNINPDLVGTWTGIIDGSGGLATLTMMLNSDGTMTSQGSTSFYNLLSGTWTASNTQFDATASASGLVVNFTAAVSGTSMAGTWTANNTAAGTFSATLQ